jgi:hypothetical protein
VSHRNNYVPRAELVNNQPPPHQPPYQPSYQPRHQCQRAQQLRHGQGQGQGQGQALVAKRQQPLGAPPPPCHSQAVIKVQEARKQVSSQNPSLGGATASHQRSRDT